MTNNYGHPNLNCQPPAFHAVGPEPRINNAVKYISNECQANSEENTRNVVAMWPFAISTSGWSQSVSVRKTNLIQQLASCKAGGQVSDRKGQSYNLSACQVRTARYKFQCFQDLSSKAKKRIKVAGPQTPSEFDVHRAVLPASV